MDAIKKKMQAMKLEKDNAMDKADACEAQAKEANMRADKVNEEVGELQKKLAQVELYSPLLNLLPIFPQIFFLPELSSNSLQFILDQIQMNFSPGNFIYIYTMVPSRSMNHTRFYDGMDSYERRLVRIVPSILFVPSFLFY